MDNKTCVITGSSRGIGRAIAEKLGEKGSNVVVNYRSSEKSAQETVEKINSKRGEAIAIKADVTKKEDVSKMREKTHQEFGEIDVLVNNAGINRDVFFKNMSDDQWKEVLDVHLNGTFYCTKSFYADIEKSDSGRVINISSIVGKQGNLGQINYATAKCGIFGFTRTLALELAKEGSTANCVAPGFIKTDMLDGVPERVKDNIKQDTPLNRFGEPEEIADVVAFIASENSSFITGEIIDVNGGKYL